MLTEDDLALVAGHLIPLIIQFQRKGDSKAAAQLDRIMNALRFARVSEHLDDFTTQELESELDTRLEEK